MQVIILAGGKGTRLHPFTFSLPKPLVPIDDRPILDWVLGRLKRQGVSDVIISTGYMAELIEAYCGTGSRWGLPIRYVREEKPLNTAGALRLIPNLAERFIVMNGDLLTTLDLADVARTHADHSNALTIAIRKRDVPIDFGVIETTANHELASYTEKPTLQYRVSMGINVVERAMVDFIKPNEAISMPDFILRIKSQGHRVGCFETNAEWLDIGRPDDYVQAPEFLKKIKQHFVDET